MSDGPAPPAPGDPPPSGPGGAPREPCVAVCMMDPDSGFCRGCYRTIEEISEWPYASRERKLEILADLDARENADRLR